MGAQIRLAYYCSGHGYGHATRVSAFACSLLSLNDRPKIHIVSSAPTHVFSECLLRGALYRYSEIDPIISQPLAYKVDRQKSIQVLQEFLTKKEEKIAVEVSWLLLNQIDCVLSDAAFLACEAAKKACLPSILITNFTFDSVYSYLGAELRERCLGLSADELGFRNGTTMASDYDVPIAADVLEPLVSQLLTGYSHADTLLILPGFIPIPSFFRSPSLPASTWVDPFLNRFRPEIESFLLKFPESGLHPSIPFHNATVSTNMSQSNGNCSSRQMPRVVRYAPLLVRPLSPNIKTREGRRSLLKSIGIPEIFHEPNQARILVVSFGGQIIRRPNGGKTPSRVPSPLSKTVDFGSINTSSVLHEQGFVSRPQFSRKGSTKIFIPGAPTPANNPASPKSPVIASMQSMKGTISADAKSAGQRSVSLIEPTDLFVTTIEEEGMSLLPSPEWIAIICGVPANWSISGEEEEDLPQGFYVAPRDVYMPDLTAIADVLLGKLGYGTVSESVAYSTPFVYVSRPLFVEEHGLRLLLDAEGTGVELSSYEYETGQWATKVEEAYMKGKQKQHEMNMIKNEKAILEMANWVIERVKREGNS